MMDCASLGIPVAAWEAVVVKWGDKPDIAPPLVVSKYGEDGSEYPDPSYFDVVWFTSRWPHMLFSSPNTYW